MISSERRTVQNPLIRYATEAGWAYLPPEETLRLRRARWARPCTTCSVPLPPIHEQQAIADILGTVDRKIQAEEQRKAALDALFRTLLHHLMTGKVRVPSELIRQFQEENHEPR